MIGVVSSVLAGKALASTPAPLPNLYFRPDGSSYHAHRPEEPEQMTLSHVEDAMEYAEYMEYMSGEQWSAGCIRQLQARQSRLNRARSLMINKINSGRIKFNG